MVVLRPHGTRSERSHRSPDMSFPAVATVLHDVSRCSMSVGGALALMRGKRDHHLESRPHRHPARGIALHEGPTHRRRTVRRLHVAQNPHPWRCGGHRKDRTPGRSASKREKARPARPHHRRFREKARPARTKTSNLGRFKRAGRIFSRLHDHTTPQGEALRAQMKPATPLLAPSRARMKPATPLLTHNAAKSSISCEQR